MWSSFVIFNSAFNFAHAPQIYSNFAELGHVDEKTAELSNAFQTTFTAT